MRPPSLEAELTSIHGWDSVSSLLCAIAGAGWGRLRKCGSNTADSLASFAEAVLLKRERVKQVKPVLEQVKPVEK